MFLPAHTASSFQVWDSQLTTRKLSNISRVEDHSDQIRATLFNFILDHLHSQSATWLNFKGFCKLGQCQGMCIVMPEALQSKIGIFSFKKLRHMCIG